MFKWKSYYYCYIRIRSYISLNEYYSASSGRYKLTPFKTMYSDMNMNSDFVPSINLSLYKYKANDNKQFLPAENIFSNEENDFVTLRNTNDNSIWLNIVLIIWTLVLLIVVLSLCIFIIFKYKRINVNQPSSTEQTVLELIENQWKLLFNFITNGQWSSV